MEEIKEKTKTGIQKLSNADIFSFDFMQDNSNRILANKINEIIDYLDNQSEV